MIRGRARSRRGPTWAVPTSRATTWRRCSRASSTTRARWARRSWSYRATRPSRRLCHSSEPTLCRSGRFRPGPSAAVGTSDRVLSELRVENLLLIERAELRLGPGLTVLTGETGAGKTVLAHALDLLLGGRARPGIVRPGAAEAYVEGVFEVGDEDLVLARRVTAEGRTRA